jgi:DNA repair protein RadA/Sms
MRNTPTFSCNSCGHSTPRWFGRCPACDAWGSASASVAEVRAPARTASLEVATLDGVKKPSRICTGIGELDRVLGGGLVPGSVVLLSGDPGIGKSTLVLQMVDGLLQGGATALLISGEESLDQVSLRATRIGVKASRLRAASSSSLPDVLATALAERPSLLVVDSIQTMQDPAHDSAAGSIVQVRECASALVRLAKSAGIAVVLIGHVTKEGTVAGPRTLEHLVDAVISLEGERTGTFRLLRALKNRFGSCDEAGVFIMEETGLSGVEDPSAMFLADRLPGVPGSAVFPALDGSRPVLIEVQALVTSTSFTQPKRVAIGCDARRLSLMIGVLSERKLCDLSVSDVFVAGAGGSQVREPAGDLAICLALLSAHSKRPVHPSTLAVGEVGLAGEIRRVPGVQRRIAEAERLGFTRAIVPRGSSVRSKTMQLVEVSELTEALRAAAQLAAA